MLLSESMEGDEASVVARLKNGYKQLEAENQDLKIQLRLGQYTYIVYILASVHSILYCVLSLSMVGEGHTLHPPGVVLFVIQSEPCRRGSERQCSGCRFPVGRSCSHLGRHQEPGKVFSLNTRVAERWTEYLFLFIKTATWSGLKWLPA